MGDWPNPPTTLPLFVSTFSAYSGIVNTSLNSACVLASATWPVANTAYFVPVAIPFDYPVKRVFWVNGSSVTTTNMDFGIFTLDGTRIYSVGSTAAAGVSAAQYTTPSPDFILGQGSYYFAVADSSTTANRGGQGNTALGITFAHSCGVLEQTSALPLPATATFATLANVMIPFCGVTRTTTGFA